MWKTLWNCVKLTIIYVLTISTISTIIKLTLKERSPEWMKKQ